MGDFFLLFDTSVVFKLSIWEYVTFIVRKEKVKIACPVQTKIVKAI